MHRTTNSSSLRDVRERSTLTSDVYDPYADRSASSQLTVGPTVSTEADRCMLAILEERSLPGETHLATFSRKERTLAESFSSLTPAESLHLERRLANPAPKDELAARFATLVPERRARLLRFLARVRWSRSATR